MTRLPGPHPRSVWCSASGVPLRPSPGSGLRRRRSRRRRLRARDQPVMTTETPVTLAAATLLVLKSADAAPLASRVPEASPRDALPAPVSVTLYDNPVHDAAVVIGAVVTL